MKSRTKLSLRAAHPDRPEDSGEELVPPVLKHDAVLQAYYDKHPALRDIPANIIRTAWFTTAHMLLRPGARVADMGCGDGMTSFAMAALNPHIEFIGVDGHKKNIARAKQDYDLPNLTFQSGDMIKSGMFEDGSLDGIINSFTLHEIYSESKYEERAVVRALERQFALLKPEGLMFIRDYAMPERGDYVLMEMPDSGPGGNKGGDTVDTMSEADLLVCYSERARPKEDPGCDGFFLEELPPRFPQTRLFRLPTKWAYEFIMRKDDRDQWETELPKEYTFFTPHDFRKNLRDLGSRVLYTTPHWDEAQIAAHFDGRFRLLDDDMAPLGPPPTSFIAVAQKMEERVSLRLHERRPAQNTSGRLRVTAMRNDIDGRLIDVVNRDVDVTEILPYRITGDGRLYVYVHEGLPRGIVNSVPRQARNVDLKSWSGHMIEALAIDSNIIDNIKAGDTKDAALFARDYLGLKPAMGATLEFGPTSFPAPDYIDERINTRYLRVAERKDNTLPPRFISSDLQGFSTQGRLREMDAQAILNAIAVGYLPHARLETQILTLAETHNIQLESWAECPLVLPEEMPPQNADLRGLLKAMTESDKRYRPSRGSAGNLRTVQSIFVDEGRIEGGLRGLKSRDMEFVIADDGAVNVAAVVPLNRHAVTKELTMGLITDFLPVPQRYKGNGMTVRAPTFTLPRDIKSIGEAKAFVAEKFGVRPDQVARLGESYFCHAGVTPQRIFPFAVAGIGKVTEGWTGGAKILAPIRKLRRMLWWDFDETVMYLMNKSLQFYGNDSDYGFDHSYRQEMKSFLMEGPGAKTLHLSDPGGLAAYAGSYGESGTSGGSAPPVTGDLFAAPADDSVNDRSAQNSAGEEKKRKLNPK